MKITDFFKNKSLRWRIMASILLTLSLMMIILLSTMRLDLIAIENIGNAYKSNTEMNYLSQQLANTEKAMETYVNYHTFESIDSYFTYRNKVEEFSENMQSNPSKNEIRQKEYIVYQLVNSFIAYSNKAISARRANSEDVAVFYKKSLDCYNVLLSQMIELNKLLLLQNANAYEQSHTKILFNTRINFIFFFILAFSIFMLLYLTITSLTKPLAEISDVAHRISKRDFDVPLFNRTSNDEIGNICRAFDRMIISIREYIDTIWEKARTEAELKEKEIEMQALYSDAQLKALQNQINPHFLFNTLNTGAQLAMMEGADKTCYFIEQVADFFRYNIQQDKKTATIDEELGLIDNFVYIMKVRFGNRLSFSKDIPDHSFAEHIPVMTLQPLVENCIKYGLKNSMGIVELKVEEDSKMITISISDNGCGIPDEIKEEIFTAVDKEETSLSGGKSDSKQNGTGIINVFTRLKLFFHRDDIFDITCGKDGIGTKFIIRIPKNV